MDKKIKSPQANATVDQVRIFTAGEIPQNLASRFRSDACHAKTIVQIVKMVGGIV